MKRATLASGIELDFIDEGPREAPALLFLHGFPESHRTWRHQIAHFSGRFRCIAPDQRGYRGSSKPQDVASYTPDKLAGDVFQLADALGIERFTVIGHDWGGIIAWLVAMLGQGSRVTRAIVANAPHPALFDRLQRTDPAQRQASQYVRTFRDTSGDAGIRAHGLLPMLARAFPPEALHNGIEPEEAANLLKDWSDPEAAFGMLNWYRAHPIDIPPMDAPFGIPKGWSPPALPRLGIPTLVVWGLDDRALVPANLDELDPLVDSLTLVRVPDCGHFVPWQAPETVNAAMEQFLEASSYREGI